MTAMMTGIKYSDPFSIENTKPWRLIKKKKKTFLVLLLSIVFAFASVQLTFADSLIGWDNPKIIEANKMISGTIKENEETGEYEKWYAFYSGGGSYKVRIYQEKVNIDMVRAGAYKFYSVNKGWQMPEYHLESDRMEFLEEWKKTDDGWYVCEVPIGKYKAGKRIAFAVSAESEAEYKFEIIGKGFKAPAKPVIKTVSGKKHAMKVSWKKAQNARGYIIQISSHKGWGKNYKEVKVSGSKSVNKIQMM